MRKIVVMKNIPQYEEMLKAIAPNWEIVFTKNKTELLEHLKDAEILIEWNKIAKNFIQHKKSKLKWVHTMSSGVDHVDWDLLGEKGIYLTSSSGAHSKQMSEAIFAGLLGYVRMAPKTNQAQVDKKWIQGELYSKESRIGEIHGKAMGILGVGEIGTEVAKVARAFSMYTFGMRRSGVAMPYIDEMYTTDEMTAMLGKCNFVVNVLPLTKHTENIIDKAAFDAMREDTVYISFGRGKTTDTQALVEALETRKIAGAVLDVVSLEPLPEDSPLWSMDNVIITPHIGGYSPSVEKKSMKIFAENLRSYIKNELPSINLIDYTRQY